MDTAVGQVSKDKMFNILLEHCRGGEGGRGYAD